jgi:murein DD-endopeptidase MepM/ murein hydrolase activator NlpD
VHSGLDFGAYHLAPITAAAPGQVTFVGWKGGYGRVVEIDHGHGFKTRYAHLQRATVQQGDTVAFGERVGQMGSTGRSTGDHLHYEVWFRGKVYDPTDFLKAGNYVQQG